eukprot:16194-Heterococcus_DN1.PRE.4
MQKSRCPADRSIHSMRSIFVCAAKPFAAQQHMRTFSPNIETLVYTICQNHSHSYRTPTNGQAVYMVARELYTCANVSDTI